MIKQLVHFCLSVHKHQFMIEEQHIFNRMLYFEHELEHELEKEPVVWQNFASKFIPITYTQRGMKHLFTLFVSLAVKQN